VLWQTNPGLCSYQGWNTTGRHTYKNNVLWESKLVRCSKTFFFFWETSYWTQGLTLAIQVLYQLSYALSSRFSFYMLSQSLKTNFLHVRLFSRRRRKNTWSLQRSGANED
jgi:hypothetical protein